jgi:hypothetical protein
LRNWCACYQANRTTTRCATGHSQAVSTATPAVVGNGRRSACRPGWRPASRRSPGSAAPCRRNDGAESRPQRGERSPSERYDQTRPGKWATRGWATNRDVRRCALCPVYADFARDERHTTPPAETTVTLLESRVLPIPAESRTCLINTVPSPGPQSIGADTRVL